ncbi:sorting nexin-29 [Anthonomus grandis grandis]|uniref:sorting nexin-29 n=1 Tax=Anthonomus grandis grandis TaxID=2921223 RepID=UPI0021652E63|nr:sorting nexin-29 [Anthonomus grandis grandis]
MNKLLKNISPNSIKKDDIIKQSLTTHLSNTVKEIQYAEIEESGSKTVVDATEAANQLCSIIEAMFLHGIRRSLTHRFKKVLADIDLKPEAPNFWPPVLVISHSQIIDQISKLTQINSEIGQCRAWVRTALNDSLLSSYLSIIRQNSSSIKSYYNNNAFIRDNEVLEVAQKLIEGVESVKKFDLPTNSSLLNNWQPQSLVLAGIWSPTLKNTPLAPCDDVASIIDEEISNQEEASASDTASVCSAISFGSQISNLKQVASLSEDEVLKIILAKNREVNEVTQISTKDELNQCVVEDGINHNIGNSLKRAGWSFDEIKDEKKTDHETVDVTRNISSPIEMTKSMEASFSDLVENYDLIGGSYVRTPDIKGLWQKFEDERNEDSRPTTPSSTTLDKKISPMNPTITLSRSASMSFSALLFRIPLEKGLDSQDFTCAGCNVQFTADQKYNVCYYTGEYFCDKCMCLEEITIPARIVHNWDFKTCPVSRKAFNYLDEIKDHPVIDFKILNPYIYRVVEEMAELLTLRNQLNLLRAYLYTCRKPIIEQLQKQMWPKEYMYEHIHQYSLSDLHEIQSGNLAQQLEKVVKFGRDHVFNCWLCSQKGFFCEICNDSKALFPFDVESVFRCDICNAVYHKNCLNSLIPCRKCERRKKREELPLLRAVRME